VPYTCIASRCSVESPSSGHVERRLERLERVRDAQRCLLGQFVGELPRAVVDGVLGDDLGDEVTLRRLLGVDVVARQDEFLGLPDTDDSGQALGRALMREDAQVHLDDAVLRLRAQHAEVRGERELEPAGDAGALDARDDRRRRLVDRVQQLAERAVELVVVVDVLLVHHLELEAGTEHRPLAQQGRGADVVVRVDLADGGGEIRDGRLVHRIAFLRAIDDHIGARSVALDPNVTVSDFGHTTHSSGSSKVFSRSVGETGSVSDVSAIVSRGVDDRGSRRVTVRSSGSRRTERAHRRRRGGTAEIRRRSAGCRPARPGY